MQPPLIGFLAHLAVCALSEDISSPPAATAAFAVSGLDSSLAVCTLSGGTGLHLVKEGRLKTLLNVSTVYESYRLLAVLYRSVEGIEIFDKLSRRERRPNTVLYSCVYQS